MMQFNARLQDAPHQVSNVVAGMNRLASKIGSSGIDEIGCILGWKWSRGCLESRRPAGWDHYRRWRVAIENIVKEKNIVKEVNAPPPKGVGFVVQDSSPVPSKARHKVHPPEAG